MAKRLTSFKFMEAKNEKVVPGLSWGRCIHFYFLVPFDGVFFKKGVGKNNRTGVICRLKTKERIRSK